MGGVSEERGRHPRHPAAPGGLGTGEEPWDVPARGLVTWGWANSQQAPRFVGPFTRACGKVNSCLGVKKKTMTIQWVAVASFLYAEIGLVLIFCLPFIPPQRWQRIFSFSVWGKIASFWNKAFLTIIILLIVLFLDAVREVRKYSSSQVPENSSAGRPSAYEHTQMRLFRSQRNLYLSGFSLFFWLVLRRLVTLITQLAKEITNKGVLKTQAENTNKAAKKFLEENENLKWVLKNHGKSEEHILETENKKLVEDQEKLKTELKKASDALFKAQNDVVTMKIQSERLSKEYDRLLKEHSELQNRLEKDNKKGL